MTTLHLPQTILGLAPQRSRPIPREKSIFATITLARDIQAQGPIARQHDDGRVTIAEGQHRLTGWPVKTMRSLFTGVALAVLCRGAAPAPVQAETLLNVSHDPTRELYRKINEAFTAFWTAQGNAAPEIEVSHGG